MSPLDTLRFGRSCCRTIVTTAAVVVISFPFFAAAIPDCGAGSGKNCTVNGNCFRISAVAGYFCVCNPGWSGSRCQTAHNPCVEVTETVLCSGRGTCSTVSDAPYYRCTCDTGWLPPSCNTFQDRCVTDGNPCANGGDCYFHPDDKPQLRCRCRSGFTGEFCTEAIAYGVAGVGPTLSNGAKVAWWIVCIAMLCAWLACCVSVVIECGRNCAAMGFKAAMKAGLKTG